jgi:hypothetical protein
MVLGKNLNSIKVLFVLSLLIFISSGAVSACIISPRDMDPGGPCEGPEWSSCTEGDVGLPTHYSVVQGEAYYGGDCPAGYGTQYHEFSCYYEGSACGGGSAETPAECGYECTSDAECPSSLSCIPQSYCVSQGYNCCWASVCNTGGSDCDNNLMPYSCIPGLYGVLHQKWESGDYDTRGSQVYAFPVGSIGSDGSSISLCDDKSYVNEWSGYINIPAGQREFLLVTDQDGNDCCTDCCRCVGCNTQAQSVCERDEPGSTCYGTGATWVCDSPRCDDSAGFKLGIDGGSPASPSGYVDEITGEPVGLTTLLSATSGDDIYSGSFTGGSYPIVVWYSGNNDPDNELEFYWRTPGNSWEAVPTESLLQCGAADTNQTLSGYVFETDGACSEDPSGNAIGGNGAIVVAYKDVGGSPVQTGSNGTVQGDGTYSIPDIPENEEITYVCISGALEDPPGEGTSYSLSCLKEDGSNPVTGCFYLDTPILMDADKTLNLGYELLGPSGWYTVIDGDVYGGDIDIVYPSSATGGFETKLIQAVNQKVFAHSGLDLLATGSEPDSDDGGHTEELLDSTPPPSAFWKLPTTLNPPTHDEVVTFEGSFEGGKVYEAEEGVLNDFVQNNVTYSVSGGGLSVVYVEGDITFNTPLTSTSDDGRILLVVNGNINVDGDLNGYASPSLTLTRANVVSGVSAPQIEVGMVASGEITIEAKTSGEIDTALVLEGPVISATRVIPSRDLGSSNNTAPAETILYNHLYFAELIDIERTHDDILNYTGLFSTTMDPIWDIN